MTDIFISRTDDLSFVDKLFDPVCGPAGDTGDSKDRGVELFWKAKHCVDETAVEINICTDWFEQTHREQILSRGASQRKASLHILSESHNVDRTGYKQHGPYHR